MYSPLPGLVYFASLLAGLLSVLGKLIANPSALKSSESLRAGDTKVRPDEPPKLPPKVPLVGHLLRVVFEGTEYLRVLHRTVGLPIFTLPIAGKSFYVVASPRLVHAIQKDHKDFSFNAIIVDVARRIFLFDKLTMAAFQGNKGPNDHDGKRTPSALQMARGQFVKHLRPGAGLNELLVRFTDEVLRDVEIKHATISNGSTIPLWKHIRTQFSTSVSGAFWGSRHPFCEDSEACWAAMEDFEAGALKLFALPLPWLTARRAHTARLRLLDALRRYADRGGFDDSATFIKCQYDACRDLGPSIMSNGGLGLAFSAIGPITSTAFWLVCLIFSRPHLLAKVRTEVHRCLDIGQDHRGSEDTQTCTINTVKLNRHCPTLFSCLVEILRLSSSQPTFRIVQEDTKLTDPTSGISYELKKNNVITLISAGMLDDSELWGSDHKEFNPERFNDSFPRQSVETFDVTRPYWMSEAQRAAFVPWGSGVHMCAGRYFAQEAILAYTALYAIAYDITDTQGRPPTSPSMSKKLSVSNAKPASDVDVCLQSRPGFERCRFKFDLMPRTP